MAKRMLNQISSMDSSSGQPTSDNTPTVPSRGSRLLAGLDMFAGKIKELRAEKIKAEELARDWEQKYGKLMDKYKEKASRCWEFENKCDEQSRELEILESQLENSITLNDWRYPPQKLRTALEALQQERAEKERKTLRRVSSI